MKVTYRIPTDTYAYIEVTDEVSQEVEASSLKRTYEDLKTAFAENPGVTRDVFNKFLDNQLMGDGNDVNDLEGMNERQMLVVQEVKKAIKRLAAKANRDATN